MNQMKVASNGSGEPSEGQDRLACLEVKVERLETLLAKADAERARLKSALKVVVAAAGCAFTAESILADMN